jgi:hypothetical protein
MIPQRFRPFLIALILSGFMSFLVSGMTTWRSIGLPPEFLEIWLKNWLISWSVACPSAYFFAPFARKLSMRLTGSA